MRWIFFLFLALFPLRSEAAVLVPTVRYSGESVLVDVFLRPEGERVNAVQGEVLVPDFLQPESAFTAGSVVGAWIEPVRIDGQRIYFSGIIPGGFSEQSGKLFTAVLRTVKQPASGSITFHALQAFAHAETAPAVRLRPQSAWVRVPYTGRQVLQTLDTEPPADFVPVLVRQNGVDGEWMVSFRAVDAESGVAGYEVAETAFDPQYANGAALPWREATNPTVLLDQSRSSWVTVRATDVFGNARWVTLPPLVPPRSPGFVDWGILLLLGVVILGTLSLFFLWRWFINKKGAGFLKRFLGRFSRLR